MVPLLWLLIIAVAALLVVRLGTTALTLTGLAKDTSEFQAYSAFFGVGFTTRESEQVVNHPIRRRIVQHLILAGQVGLTSVIVPLVVTFVNIKTLREGVIELGLIVGTLVLLWFVINTRLFRGLIDRSIKVALRRRGELRLDIDPEVLLRLPAGFTISEIALHPSHPLLGRSLSENHLVERGVFVLGLTRRDGTYVGVPSGDMVAGPFDVLTVYGCDTNIRKLMAGPDGPAHI